VRRLLREQPLIGTALATLLAAAAVYVIARITGADVIGRVFEHLRPVWIPLLAATELATYPAYVLAYRSVARMHGKAPLSLPIVTRLVVAGFGPFALGGGFSSDQRTLAQIDEDTRSARVRVLALGTLEWAILAPAACITAIVLLAQGANILPSLLWPWALAVPPSFALAFWASAPKRSAWIARITRSRAQLVVEMLEGIAGLRELIVGDPKRNVWAVLGITAYWAADMTALWAALRIFGIDLGVGKLIIAYSTGYAATRRSLPLGGAGATEFLMTYALYWVREPLAPALAAVLAYRAFNFLLVAIPALVAQRQLIPMIEELAGEIAGAADAITPDRHSGSLPPEI
jgi:uncharacterized membrane protein YbhN (UPF0104 family)